MKNILLYLLLIILLFSCFDNSSLNGTWQVENVKEMDIVNLFVIGTEIKFQDNKLITELGLVYNYEKKGKNIYVDIQGGVNYLFKEIDSKTIQLEVFDAKIKYQKRK